MADTTADLSLVSKRYRTWLVLFLIVATHATINLTLNPIGASDNRIPDWLAMVMFGAVLSQPVLFATWAAIGPGAAVLRLPLSLFANTVVSFAIIPTTWNLFSERDFDGSEVAEVLMLFLATFATVCVALLIARRIIGWQICFISETPDSAETVNQFSMKYLLVLTTLCAMVLAIGRGAAGGGFWAESSFWQELTSAVPEFVGLALLALFPTLIIPLLAISGRPSLRTIIMFPFLWAGLTYLAVEVESIDNTSPLSKLAWDIVLIQAGAATAGFLTAITLRFAGYRLLNHRSEWLRPIAVSG